MSIETPALVAWIIFCLFWGAAFCWFVTKSELATGAHQDPTFSSLDLTTVLGLTICGAMAAAMITGGFVFVVQWVYTQQFETPTWLMWSAVAAVGWCLFCAAVYIRLLKSKKDIDTS